MNVKYEAVTVSNSMHRKETVQSMI